jgi:hypothetical protein
VTPRELAGKICRALAEVGHEAYLVGGCVRDIVLGREPSDYDVTTDATPERVESLFPGSLTVGAKFGVVVVVEEGIQVEVATFRSDISYSDGRHPDRVVYSRSVADDVRRRDFTINGLLMDPRTAEVIDLVGGRADLEARLIRAIGDPEKRFIEDKLRMLRAIRFAARFDFAIELTTFAAIRRLAPEIHQVSAERVRDELTRLLTEGSARRGFELLDASGLLPAVLPEVARMKGVEQPPEFHPEGDVWIHTRLMLEGLPAGVGARHPDPLRQPRRRGRRHGRGHLPPASLLERGDRADRLARPEPPSFHRRTPHASSHAQALRAPASFRGAPRITPPRLPFKPCQARYLRFRVPVSCRNPARGGSPAPAGHRQRLEGARLATWTAVRQDPDGRRGGAAGGEGEDEGRGVGIATEHGTGSGAYWRLGYWPDSP